MKIVVVGLGYVGCSLAVLLAQKNKVIAIDIDDQKIDKLKKNISPVKDKLISKYLRSKKLSISYSNDLKFIKKCRICNCCYSNRL